MIQRYKQSVPRCGAIFLEVALGFDGFNYAGPETLIKNYTTHMTGLDATVRALETAKGLSIWPKQKHPGPWSRGESSKSRIFRHWLCQEKRGWAVHSSVFCNSRQRYTPPTNLWFHIMTPRAHTAQFNHIAADMHDHQCSLHLHQASLVPFASLSERTVAS